MRTPTKFIKGLYVISISLLLAFHAFAEEPQKTADPYNPPESEYVRRFLPYVQLGLQYDSKTLVANNSVTGSHDGQESALSFHPIIGGGLDFIYYRKNIIFIPNFSLKLHLGSGQESTLGLAGLPQKELPVSTQGYQNGFLIGGTFKGAARFGLTSLHSQDTGIGVYFMTGPDIDGQVSKLLSVSAQGEIGMSHELGLISTLVVKAFNKEQKLTACIGAVVDGTVSNATSNDAFSKDYKNTEFLAIRAGGHVLVFIGNDFAFDFKGTRTVVGDEFAGKRSSFDSFLKAHVIGPVHSGLSFQFQALDVDPKAFKYGAQETDPHPDIKPAQFTDIKIGLTLDINLDDLIQKKKNKVYQPDAVN